MWSSISSQNFTENTSKNAKIKMPAIHVASLTKNSASKSSSRRRGSSSGLPIGNPAARRASVNELRNLQAQLLRKYDQQSKEYTENRRHKPNRNVSFDSNLLRKTTLPFYQRQQADPSRNRQPDQIQERDKLENNSDPFSSESDQSEIEYISNSNHKMYTSSIYSTNILDLWRGFFKRCVIF